MEARSVQNRLGSTAINTKSGRLRCGQCENRFKNWMDVKLHFKTEHNVTKPVNCQRKRCNSFFSDKKSLNEHQEIAEHVPGKKYKRKSTSVGEEVEQKLPRKKTKLKSLSS